MTKKEKQSLNQSRCSVEREGNQYIVSFCMTHTQLLTLKIALESWKTTADGDIDSALIRAAHKLGVEL